MSISIKINDATAEIPCRLMKAIELMAYAGIGDGGSRYLRRYHKSGRFGKQYKPTDSVAVKDGDEFIASPMGHF